MDATVDRFRTNAAPAGVLAEARLLCDRAFDGDFSDADWNHALGGWHAIVTVDGDIVAHGAVVTRQLLVGDRPIRTGYVEAVATDPDRQRTGHGTAVMRELGAIIEVAYDLGALATSSHRFYERLGWERWRGPTYVDDGQHRIRTQDEDNGIMVLRFGPSLGVDRTDAIACEARPGDDW